MGSNKVRVILTSRLATVHGSQHRLKTNIFACLKITGLHPKCTQSLHATPSRHNPSQIQSCITAEGFMRHSLPCILLVQQTKTAIISPHGEPIKENKVDNTTVDRYFYYLGCISFTAKYKYPIRLSDCLIAFHWCPNAICDSFTSGAWRVSKIVAQFWSLN